MSETPESDGDAADEATGTDPSPDGGETAPAVDAEDVKHVAELARVRLDDAEVERFTDEFAEILDSFETLDEVPETEREEELVNVMRADEVREGLSQEEALANAAETEDGFFKGPKVS